MGILAVELLKGRLIRSLKPLNGIGDHARVAILALIVPNIEVPRHLLHLCYLQRLGINLRDYLNDILPKFPDLPASNVADLSPLCWRSS